MVKQHVHFTEGQVATLRALAARAGISFAEMMRRCLDIGLREAQKQGLYEPAPSPGPARKES
jgi:hypothetical protein